MHVPICGMIHMHDSVDSDWLDGYLKLGQAAASLQDHSRAVQAFTLVVSQLAEGSSQRSVVDALLATSNEFTVCTIQLQA